MANRAIRIRPALRATAAAVVLSIGVLCAGCGAAPSSPASKDATFRKIQRHEADLRRARAQARKPDTRCPRRCVLAAEALEHADALCHLAQQADDDDAIARCHQARRSAAGLQASTRAGCECRPPSEAERER